MVAFKCWYGFSNGCNGVIYCVVAVLFETSKLQLESFFVVDKGWLNPNMIAEVPINLCVPWPNKTFPRKKIK